MLEGLRACVGSEGVLDENARYAIGGREPPLVLAPQSEQEIVALIEHAKGYRLPFAIAGSGTHLGAICPPEPYSWTLCTLRLNRLIDYAPADLVITLGAGMRLSEAQAILGQHGQYLPWNPPLPDEATIGGIVASGRSGAWRFRHGTPRDRLLALRAVRGDGTPFKSGAKVVKSVAGYDLHRLMCGSWGTLGVITEITLKVAPLPPARQAVQIAIPRWDSVEPTLAQLMQAPLQPERLDLVRIPSLTGVEAPILLLEFAGSEAGVAWQLRWLQEQGFEANPVPAEWLERLRDWLAPRQHHLLLKLLMRSSEVADWMARLSAVEGCNLYAHAGSGVLYVSCEADEPAKQALQALQGASAGVGTPRWYALQMLPSLHEDELPTPLHAERRSPLAQRLKSVFDPHSLLPPL